MHQFIGDLMTSTSAQPVKDAAQQDALRTAWETAGHEALGLKIPPAAPPAQNRQPHNKVPAGYSLQPLTEPVDRTGEVVTSAQQLQHRTCTCPACPFSSSFSSSSSPSFQTLRSSRDTPSLQTNPAQSKESTAGPVSLGLCLGLGLNLEDEARDSSDPCNPELHPHPQQQQNQDRAVSTQNPNPNVPHPHPPPQLPTFPCLCCHRGFQTCTQLLRHQQGTDAHFAPHYHHHHHHHHCALMSCLPCPQLPHPAQNPPPFPCLSCQRTFQTCAQLLRHQQGHIQPDGPAQHPCMHCPASFPRPSQLLQHQRLLSSAVADAIAGPASASAGMVDSSPSPAASLSIDTPDSPLGDPDPDLDTGRPGSAIGTVSSSLSSPGSSTFSLDGLSSRGGKTEVPPQGRPPGAGKDRKGLLPYACEDCGQRFRDAPSRNKHQELEHYPDPEDQEEGLDLDKDGGLEEAVEGMM
ncbi:hypothetical protein JZ751_007421 [Albula glossodonta]|uniref:C2H2-type domain-containing protein n=1 Tax=Albula glossodonta TaxID=121402 RepID=A0A8T2N5B6_9TELE|nr:hypothetical protein JZ751_007421 [Albula glossodonta]